MDYNHNNILNKMDLILDEDGQINFAAMFNSWRTSKNQKWHMAILKQQQARKRHHHELNEQSQSAGPPPPPNFTGLQNKGVLMLFVGYSAFRRLLSKRIHHVHNFRMSIKTRCIRKIKQKGESRIQRIYIWCRSIWLRLCRWKHIIRVHTWACHYANSALMDEIPIQKLKVPAGMQKL